MQGRSSFLIVANRLPVDRVGDGYVAAQPRRAGHRDRPCHAAPRRRLARLARRSRRAARAVRPGRHELIPVPLSESEVELYYEGFSNATLWPLYHDVVAPPVYSPASCGTPTARSTSASPRPPPTVAAEGAVVWVQDYQLQLVPAMLRKLRPDLRIGFFLHIPFPPVELFCAAARGAGRSSRVCSAPTWSGFQLPGGAANFLRLCRRLLGLPYKRARDLPGRTGSCRAEAFPISVDFGELDELVREPHIIERAKEIRARAGRPRARAARRGPAGLHQGHRAAAEGVRRAAQGGRLQPGRGGVRADRHAQPGAGGGVPAAARRHRAAGRPDQRRARRARASSRSSTSTSRTAARSWPRSIWRPTSWWSRRCATG